MVSQCWFWRSWVIIKHRLAICLICCLFTPVVCLFWIIRRFQEQFWWNRIQKKMTGLCSFLLISSLFLENVSHPDLVDDYIRPFLSSCVCYGISTNKNLITFTQKRKKGQSSFLQRHFKIFHFAQLGVLDWKVWFIEKPVGWRKGKTHQVCQGRDEYNMWHSSLHALSE